MLNRISALETDLELLGDQEARWLAQLRIALLQVEAPPKLEEEPGWMVEQMDCFLIDAGRAPIATMTSCHDLMLSWLYLQPDMTADISSMGTGGNILVEWHDTSLQWLIYVPNLPWPGCHVRCYHQSNPESPALGAKTFRFIGSLLQYSQQVLVTGR